MRIFKPLVFSPRIHFDIFSHLLLKLTTSPSLSLSPASKRCVDEYDWENQILDVNIFVLLLLLLHGNNENNNPLLRRVFPPFSNNPFSVAAFGRAKLGWHRSSWDRHARTSSQAAAGRLVWQLPGFGSLAGAASQTIHHHNKLLSKWLKKGWDCRRERQRRQLQQLGSCQRDARLKKKKLFRLKRNLKRTKGCERNTKNKAEGIFLRKPLFRKKNQLSKKLSKSLSAALSGFNCFMSDWFSIQFDRIFLTDANVFQIMTNRMKMKSDESEKIPFFSLSFFSRMNSVLFSKAPCFWTWLVFSLSLRSSLSFCCSSERERDIGREKERERASKQMQVQLWKRNFFSRAA